MAWAPIPQRLRDGAEMIRLRRATGLPVAALLGHVTLLWLWALDNAPDGRLPAEPYILAEATQWEGDEEEWLGALAGSGMIFPADAETGEWEIAYFAELMASYTEAVERRKASSRDRVRLHRERARAAAGGAELHRADVFARDGHACVYCGADDGLCLDRVIPAARGGGDGPENLATACRRCVGRKAGRTPEEAGLTLRNVTTPPPPLPRVLPVTGGNAHTTQHNPTHTTLPHPTGVARAQGGGRGIDPVTEGVTEGPTWDSPAEKFAAFRDYAPSDDDKRWAAREVPEVDIAAETAGNYAEWCDTNRRKLLADYDNPTGFWRRWMRGAAERQTRNQSGRGRGNGRRNYADDRLSLGEMEPSGDSRERAQRRRAGALAGERGAADHRDVPPV